MPDRRVLTFFAVVAAIIGSWALITPEGGGPDEPGHLVRAGGVARFQDRDGASYEVTDHYLLPDVTCWIFQPSVSASCALPRATSGATISIPTPAYEYPIWSHLVSGAASRLPGNEPLWWARGANAAVAAALVAVALVAVRGRLLPLAGVACALTPMAWFSMGIVNPSSMAIAGAIALWVGLVHRPDLGWLVAAGWSAVALPRRDGLIWATLALIAVLVITDRRALEWWRELRTGPRLALLASTAVTVAWGLTSSSDDARLVAVVPLAIPLAEAARAGWGRMASGGARELAAAATLLTVSVVAVVAITVRRDGWDGDLAGRIAGETGANLVEAIGRLGWLDTPLPWLVVVGWIMAIGVLLGIGLIDRGNWAVGALALLAVTIASAWVLELLQGGSTGTYWQGRYSLPILAGVPIVLGAAELRPEIERSIGRLLVVGVLALDNVAIVAAARRFGVGVDGSQLPWDWDTYRAPIPPMLAIGVHLFATGVLAALMLARRPTTSSGHLTTRSAVTV